MLDSIDKIWDYVINNLQGSESPDNYELWLKPCKPATIEGDRFFIRVPNRFFVDRLEKKYKPRIEELLAQAQDKKLNVVFISESESKQDNTQTLNPDVSALHTEPQIRHRTQHGQAHTRFNPKYTFSNFVVGPSNRFAQAAAEAVAREPGRAYNPLFIYGGVGLGKTHLLHAIGHLAIELDNTLSAAYITCEAFTNEMIDALRRQKISEFRIRYRGLDLLLIDDVQFLIGKEGIQDEFFHLFNALYEAHKQVIVTSDAPPGNMPTLQDRLRSRFQWGVIADISPPDLETRIAILRKKAEVEEIDVPDDVLLYLASEIKTNIRDLEGALIRVLAFASLTGTELTVDNAKETIKDILLMQHSKEPITIERIQEVVCRHFHLDLHDMKTKRRTDSVAFPRQIAMYLSRVLTEYSTVEIGNAFGGRDHATVLHACEKIKHRLSSDPYFTSLVNKITQEVQSGGIK
jgi:chromosomal replication initiator protein